MRQRFRARELWLFAPFLLIIAGALYWARIEKVEPPNAQGIYVSEFKVEPSPGFWQAEGFSHQVTVKLFYKGSRPKWWGNPTKYQNPIGAFDSKDFFVGAGKNDPAHALAFGSTLTYQRAGKTRAWAPPNGTTTLSMRFVDDHYVFVHQVSLAQAPQKLGEIGFRGLYVIGDQEPFVVSRTLRAAGETLPPTPATSTGIKLLKVDATPFFAINGTGRNGKKQTTANCHIRLTVRDFDAPPANEKLPGLMFSEIEVGDESVKKLETNTGNGMDWGVSEDGKSQKPLNGQRQGVLFVEVAPNFKTTGRLKLRGKISIGARKPVPFAVTLPPRSSKPQVAGSFDSFEIPLWRAGCAVIARIVAVRAVSALRRGCTSRHCARTFVYVPIIASPIS